MKKMIVILMMFVVFALSAQVTDWECPVDGMYETTGRGWIDGVVYYAVPYSRIGVSYANRVIYTNYDWNADGDLSDEQVVTYRAFYLPYYVMWQTHELGFSETKFLYLSKTQEWRSIIEADDGGSLILEYVLVDLW